MPMYEFQCPDEECGLRYEKQLTIKDFADDRQCCPGCGAVGKHVLFAPAVHTRLSLMHPRHMRGQKGEFKRQKGCVIE